MRNTLEQLSLELLPSHQASFDNFYFSSSNLYLRDFLFNYCSGKDRSIENNQTKSVYLYTPKGNIGISHLLEACYFLYRKRGFISGYFRAEELINVDIDETINYQLLCIDDVDLLSNMEALFHFYNYHYDNEVKIIFGSHHLPSHMNNILKDMQTRFAQSLILKLNTFEDDDLEKGLFYYLRRLEWESPEKVINKLLTYYSRDALKIFKFIQNVDKYKKGAKSLSLANFHKAMLLAQDMEKN